ncbi:MAG: SpoIVB peptidase [Clostridiales bacterium]|nr:SpoIVB peptidase [Clostridiales bacterium]
MRSKIGKLLGITACLALILSNYTGQLRAIRLLENDVHIQLDESYTVPFSNSGLFTADSSGKSMAVSFSRDESLARFTGSAPEDNHVTIRLLGMVPVKRINVHVRDNVSLVPGGLSVGVTLHTRGALVVGVSSVTLSNGEEVSPAAVAGVKAGDLIEKINGVEIKNAAHLAQICNESKEEVVLTAARGNEQISMTMRPAFDPADGQYRMGMWVRDSTAGVGTLSFYDPVSNRYSALGHAITDVDTRTDLTVRDGQIVQSTIVDIVQGAQGDPGELRGTFGAASLPLGTIEMNCQYGIYGRMYQPYRNPLYPDGILMAYPEEAKVGPAQLLTTLSEDGVQAYDCRIIKVTPQSSPAQKGMVVEITDAALLKATGGIVQGMSGSPVIQNKKLIGVITHVFINDPTKGYCMYAQWMKEQIP